VVGAVKASCCGMVFVLINLEMDMENIDIARQCRSCVLSVFGQCAQYNWSADFIKSEINGIVEKIKGSEWFIPIDINLLSQSELEILGFIKWDDSGLMLIPIWIKPFIADRFFGSSVGGGSDSEILTASIDNDVRFGFLAYGVYPKS
jgi:hypothetical protein